MSQSFIDAPSPQYSWQQRLALWLYTGLTHALIVILLLVWLIGWITRRAGFNLHRLSRFSIYHRPVSTTELLIHCVSVGEVAVAATLIKAWRQRQPNLSVTVTTTTPTGANNVRNLLGDSVQHVYLPYDTGWMMQRLLRRVKPKQVCIVEVELWPNMLKQCVKKRIPAYLVNGRMTDKSAEAYAKLSALVTPMMQSLTHVCAQSAKDLANFRQLGCEASRCSLSGNIKFDMQNQTLGVAEPLLRQWSWQQQQILVAGSTHEPEEAVMLTVFKQLLSAQPALKLVLVPRHPQRFDKVEQILKQSELPYARSSNDNDNFAQAQVILVDQMGVLTDLYRFASIAFVGGSIAQRGGHNPLEPALAAVPTLMGEHIYNNPQICQVLQQAGGLVVTSNEQQLIAHCRDWLQQPDKRRADGLAGQQVITDNQGATDHTLAILAP